MASGGMSGGSGSDPPAGRPPREDHAAAARRRLRAQIEASQRARTQKTLALITSAVSALVLLTAGSGWLLAGYVSSHIGRVNAGTSGAPPSGPLNILLAGVDVRSGLTERQQHVLHVGHAAGHNSDTLMLIHISADHRHIEVISLPRDSWVRIPGYGMSKINAAYGLGGPRLMVRTVELATGLPINDFIEVNFLGFVKIINALGGVDICLPYAVNDPYSGLRISAGRHHVNAVRALQFARDRHSFPLSDLTRIADQQQLLSSVLSEAVSSGTLANPVRFSRFLAATTSATTVDERFNVTGLAEELRFIRPSAVSFTTVPLASTDYQTPDGESALLWDTSAAKALFRQVKADRPISHRHHGRHPGTGRRSSQTGVWQVKRKTAAQAACH